MAEVHVCFVFVLLFSLSLARPILKKSTNDHNVSVVSEDVMTHIAAVNEENDLDLFEGDIVLPQNNVSLHSVRKRNARRSRRYLWQEKKVPYVISQELIDNRVRATILKAIKQFHIHTCLRFIPRTSEKNWVYFVKQSGCWSSVGRSYWTPGAQRLSLGRGCNISTTVMHELLHTIGFWHEQARADRNQYVEILWENIREGKEHNFLKGNHLAIDNLDKPYDFQSLMHYGNTYFSKNGMDTIRSIAKPNLKLGQRIGFSQLDIDEVNELYDCNSTNAGWSLWSSFSPCNDKCKKKRERFCASSNGTRDCPGLGSHGVQEEIVTCPVSNCSAPVNGHWSRWSSWSLCDTVCGPGTRTRVRTCDDPLPSNGGLDCLGEKKEETSCAFQSCGLGPDDCEFEKNTNGLCVWSQDDKDDLSWIRLQGPTPSKSTGPQGDHTSGGGHYLFVEASSPARTGQKARLISKTFSGSNRTTCFILSYNMFGNGMGTLSILLANANEKKTLLSKAGDQGESWHTAYIDLQSLSDYKVIIEGVLGSNFRSDIAIDDVLFILGSCRDTPIRNLGCYRDKTRPLEKLFKNVRNSIDWSDMRKTVMDCAKAAKENGYKVFGIQFYGECWSSPRAKEMYNKDGQSQNCWNGVGKEWTFQAYELL